MCERFLLVFRFRDAFLVAEFAGFFEFVFKFLQSALVGGLSLRIEHLACMAEVTSERSRSGEVLGTRSVDHFFPWAAEATAKARANLKQRGQPIGAYDVLVAGTALAHELILVTSNVREFRRVEGLRIEDWRS